MEELKYLFKDGLNAKGEPMLVVELSNGTVWEAVDILKDRKEAGV